MIGLDPYLLEAALSKTLKVEVSKSWFMKVGARYLWERVRPLRTIQTRWIDLNHASIFPFLQFLYFMVVTAHWLRYKFGGLL